MMNGYQGLRDWLAQIEQRGELTTLEDVDWNLEMGAIVDVLYREHPPYPPALIFDKIKDHKPGYRALFGHFASPHPDRAYAGRVRTFRSRFGIHPDVP
jgi:3-polyprenyl-4-hydroxybenzoate decarboxylase